jgi:hypothetical protein
MALEEEAHNRRSVVKVEISSLRLADHPGAERGDAPDDDAAGPQTPVVVHRPTMRVTGGAARVRAALRRGETTIVVQYLDGPDSDEHILSTTLNVTPGVPLTLADRKRAAESIMTSHPQWSDRRVASATGISPGTVAEIRKRAGDAAAAAVGRIGQDGRVRPLDGSTGRRLAAQLLLESPELSLRQVAKAAAISPETVRDVRNRLRNGVDFMPARRPRKRVKDAASPRPEVKLDAPLAVVRSVRRRPEKSLDRIATVNRLKADPSLRYSETGRNLLRLLSLHAQWTEDWERITNSLPPHCSDAVTELARQFADLWADLAAQGEHGVTATG